MVLTALIATKSLKRSDETIYSLGILIDAENLQVSDIFVTYAVDIIIICVSPILIQAARYYKRLEGDNYEKYKEFVLLNINLHCYYFIMIGIAVVISSISTLFIPSAICALLLVINLIILFMWSFKVLAVFKKPIGFLYNLGFYITILTFLVTYVLEVPIIKDQIPESIPAIIGVGWNFIHLQWYFWFRNLTFVLYI